MVHNGDEAAGKNSGHSFFVGRPGAEATQALAQGETEGGAATAPLTRPCTYPRPDCTAPPIDASRSTHDRAPRESSALLTQHSAEYSKNLLLPCHPAGTVRTQHSGGRNSTIRPIRVGPSEPGVSTTRVRPGPRPWPLPRSARGPWGSWTRKPSTRSPKKKKM